MPFKSKAQRRKFAELLVKGEISEETYEEWNRETGSAETSRTGEVRQEGKVPAAADWAGRDRDLDPLNGRLDPLTDQIAALLPFTRSRS